jgi:periplasmic divalent cation tolerance protein
MSVVSIYCVFANREEAETIGRAMIERRLAACINIMGGCHSIYRWDGKVATAEEAPAIFKTTYEQSAALVEAVSDMHSYDVPAIAVWPIATLPEAYAEWVEENVGYPVSDA